MLLSIQNFLSTIQQKKNAIPQTGILRLDDPQKPLSFQGGVPIANVAVAETDTEVSNFRSGSLTRFVDARNNNLHEYDGSNWTTRMYYGEEAFFRPQTLCFSAPQARFYYADSGFRIMRVNVGTNPYTTPIIYDGRLNGVATQLPVGPTARRRHTLTHFNGALYLLGGNQEGVGSSELWRYDIVNETWTQLVNAPNTLVDHRAFVSGGYLWSYGGAREQGGTPVDDFFRYDLSAGTWETLSPGPVAVDQHAATIDDQGRLYIHGGRGGAGKLDTFYRYDPSLATWETLPVGPNPRDEHTLTYLDGGVYVFGGVDTVPATLNELWRYDISTNTWELIDPVEAIPTKERHTAGVFNGRLYVFGGNGGGGNLDRYKDLWEYYPIDNKWREVLLRDADGSSSSIPVRQVPAGAMVGRAFYFHGGNAIDPESGTENGYDNDFWVIE